MYTFLLFIFVVNAAFLMLAILMQSNNAGGLSSTFGGVGGASSTFGTRETVSFLHKFTVTMTVSFFVLAIVIGLMSRSHFENQTTEQSLIMQKGNSVPVEGLPTLDDKKLPLDDAAEETSGEATLPSTETEPVPVEENK
ncbi:MAG: preprotein translocase subunit SecG [Candidatus Delongbacteria bacterium]|nr:preprotein translocase subunit SecG [Candidatus Delongbacteria bacterium]